MVARYTGPMRPTRTSPVRARGLAFRRGFSLPELVVVLGVLTILVGLLLPSVRQAWHQGRLTSLLGEIQQQAALVEMFGNEHNDLYPFAGFDTVGDCAHKWYEALVREGMLDDRAAERASVFQLSLCMVYDARRMKPGNTPDQTIYDEAPVPVYRRQTRLPASKGMLYWLFTWPNRSPWPARWCCYPDSSPGPVAMADGSSLIGRWMDFLPDGEFVLDEKSGVGFPVITPWYGVEGRDR